MCSNYNHLQLDFNKAREFVVGNNASNVDVVIN